MLFLPGLAVVVGGGGGHWSSLSLWLLVTDEARVVVLRALRVVTMEMGWSSLSL